MNVAMRLCRLLPLLVASIVCVLLGAASAEAANTISVSNVSSNTRITYAWSSPHTPTGTVQAVYSYTSGSQSTVGDTWTLDLSADTQSTPSGTVTFDPAAIATSGCTALCVPAMTSSSGKSYFPDGTYSVQLRYPTAGGLSTSNTVTIALDGATSAPTLTNPATDSVIAFGYGSELYVKYDLHESPKAGTVKLAFAPRSPCTGDVVLTMANLATMDAMVDMFWVESGKTLAISGTLQPRCTYDVTLSFQDVKSHAAASATSTNLVYGGAPAAPAGLTAEPIPGGARLSWDAAQAFGYPVEGYWVTDVDWNIVCTTYGDLTCDVTGLTPGQTYEFAVSAFSFYEGDISELVSVTVPDVPAAPTSVTGSVASVGAIAVSWTDSATDNGMGISGYTVTASPGGGQCFAAAGDETCEVWGLDPGTAYTFTVKATNDVGDSADSIASAPVTTWDVPDPPTAVTAVAGEQQAVVSFTAPADSNGSPVTGYTVTSSPGGHTCAPTGVATSCTVHGLSAGTGYTFSVTATSAVGVSDASAPSNAVTPFGAPGAPSDVAAEAGDGEALVSFTPGSSNGATVTDYVVTAQPGGASCTATAPATSCVVSGLTNGVTYTFTVVTRSNAADSSASPASSPVTPSAPPAPTDTTTTTTPTDSVPVTPVLAPSPTELPLIEAPLPDVKPATKPITLTAGNHVTLGRVATAAGIKTGPAVKVTLKVGSSSQRYCVIRKGRLIGRRAGKCSVKVTARSASGTSTKTVVVKVAKPKRVVKPTRLVISGV